MRTRLDELETGESRRAVTEALAALFRQWRLSESEQALALGVGEAPFLRTGGPIPRNDAMLTRAGHLLAVGRALARLFPGEGHRARSWVWTEHPGLDGYAPVTLMLGGLDGLKRVRRLAEAETAGDRHRPSGPLH